MGSHADKSIFSNSALRYYIIVNGGGLVRKPGKLQRGRLLFAFIKVT